MGLDMYAYAFKPERLVDPNAMIGLELVNQEPAERQPPEKRWYWRKFNALHGWMERLYKERGGTESFNCIPIQLTAADIDRLEQDMLQGNLKPVEGFFFGPQVIDAEDLEDLKTFIAQARDQLSLGRAIVYDSWW